MPARKNSYCLIPTDCGEITLIKVSKALSTFAADRVENIARRRSSALHRGGRHSRHRLTVAFQNRHVADDEYFWMTADAQIVIHLHTSHSILRRAKRGAK